jgi:hypothetical protein
MNNESGATSPNSRAVVLRAPARYHYHNGQLLGISNKPPADQLARLVRLAQASPSEIAKQIVDNSNNNTCRSAFP